MLVLIQETFKSQGFASQLNASRATIEGSPETQKDENEPLARYAEQRNPSSVIAFPAVPARESDIAQHKKVFSISMSSKSKGCPWCVEIITLWVAKMQKFPAVKVYSLYDRIALGYSVTQRKVNVL